MLRKSLLVTIILCISICTIQNFSQAASIPPRQTAYVMNTKFPHWQKSTINVYIPQEDSKSGAMQRAFLKWQTASSNKISFKFVEKEKDADINVIFADKVDGSDGPIGSYNVTINGMNIQKGEITIATKSPNIKKYSNDYIYTVMLHEVGHVIGMPDQTRKPSSIMNMPVRETQDITKIDIRKLYYVNNWSYSDRRFNQ